VALVRFPFNDTELGLLLTNGFVVSERLGSDRFATVFYRLFNDDMPVFVSADSVLSMPGTFPTPHISV